MNNTNLMIIIAVGAVISLAVAIAVIGLPKPATIEIPPPTPIKPSVCNNMCYNISMNYNTDGYHPNFLKQPLVKTTCLDALRDSTTLGYCSNRLGTL